MLPHVLLVNNIEPTYAYLPTRQLLGRLGGPVAIIPFTCLLTHCSPCVNCFYSSHAISRHPQNAQAHLASSLAQKTCISDAGAGAGAPRNTNLHAQPRTFGYTKTITPNVSCVIHRRP